MGAWEPDRFVTDNDRGRSRTAFSLDELRRAAEPMRRDSLTRMLDIGCGFGGLSSAVGQYVGAKEVHGVDIDPRVVEEAGSKGVEVVLQDAGADALPYPDGHFDVVMTLGMMDYLVSFDPMLREVNRLLAVGGNVLVALPNLSSWHNRMMLLAGYQPRDIEISSERLVGLPRGYEGEGPAGHIHIPTTKAFTELMEYHGFRTVKLTAGRPAQRPAHPVLRMADAVLGSRPSLARRFYYVGVKERSIPVPERSADMPYQSLPDPTPL
jgi:SAM-dependent methyltransferase